MPRTKQANFPARLRAAREKAGLTVAELAERCGITRQQVYLLERGVHGPKLDTVVKIAEALGVTLSELV